MASFPSYPRTKLNPDAAMTSRALSTIYSNLLSRMAFRSLRTFAPSDSNSESDIPTNYSDSDSLSKQLPHTEGTKNRAFNRFLKTGSAEEYRRGYYGNIELPQSRYKTGEILTELKNIVFNIKPQMMRRNTCNSRRWSHTDATNVESNAFCTNIAVDAINDKGPGIIHPMVGSLCINERDFPSIDNYLLRSFLEKKLNIMLENYGLYIKGNIDWHARGSKFQYISVDSFMWLIVRVHKMYRETLYKDMFKRQIYVLENCPSSIWKYNIVVCYWIAPPFCWYKFNVSVVLKENLDGTKEGFCGGVVRDCTGRILEIFHKPFPDATSKDEVFLLGVHHGIEEILRRRLEVKKIILEVDRRRIFKVLSRKMLVPDVPEENMKLYFKIFATLSKFFRYKVLYQFHQGNAVANRVAHMAPLLTMGQSFPIGDRGLIAQVRCDQMDFPRYEIATNERFEVGELSDDEFDYRLIDEV